MNKSAPLFSLFFLIFCITCENSEPSNDNNNDLVLDVGIRDASFDTNGDITPRDTSNDVADTSSFKTFKMTTFDETRLAFGEGFNQTVIEKFTFPTIPEQVKSATMFVRLTCPTGGCNAWDVFANIKIKDPTSLVGAERYLEMGRYITPYGVDNAKVPLGFPIDVTDFKSLLTGEVELYARIETWGADGWNLSVDFEFEVGDPDYPYYAITPIITYDEWSTSGVPYGVAHAFDLSKRIEIPAAAKATHFRTTISGWGHATPTDNDQRPCAEWCFRTHQIDLVGIGGFEHDLGPLGCDENPVQPQAGNWQPDRAGWCPGMAVPVRQDQMFNPSAGKTLAFEYDFQDWVSDGGTVSDNEGSFYAISSFIVVKSDTPIASPIVLDD